jgi:hypothetical protein
LDKAFKEGPYLQGNDLKRLCSPEQINYNLLKTIFLQWEAEINKLQNPYFDHSAPAVKNALKTYMEVLSRHIHLDKGSLRPLLQQAVEETIYQVFSPLYFFENFLWPIEIDILDLKEITKLRRFIRINQAFIKELVNRWEEEGLNEVTLQVYHEGLKSLSLDWSESWESTEDYEVSFSKVVALRTQSIWKTPVKAQSQEKKEITKNVNQQFAREIVSLNDTLQKDQTTLADQLNKEAENINNLKQSLNINQKFRFVNEIYDGDTNEFDKILDKIDSCKDYQEAMLTLENNTNFKTERNMKNQAVKELIDLVSKRFSEPGPAFGGRPFSTK